MNSDTKQLTADGVAQQYSTLLEENDPTVIAQQIGGIKAPKWHTFVIVLLLAAMLAQGISNIMGMSVTWDEAMYVGIGNYIFRTGHIDFRHIDGLHFHPVWSFYLNSILLLFLNLPANTLHIPADALYTYTAGRALLFQSGYSPETILFLIRLPILMQSLLLGFLIYRFATRLFGANAGLLALSLLAFDPNFLAHSAIACTDSSVTVWMFASVYAYYELLKAPSKRLLLLTGISVGIACLSKISAPIFLSIIMPAMWVAENYNGLQNQFITQPFWKNHDKGAANSILTAQKKSLLDLLIIAAVTAFMIWGAYGFGLNTTYKTASEIKSSGITGAKAIMQSTNFIKLPLAPYANVVAFCAAAASGSVPRHAYLLGQQSTEGFRAYALITFLLKTPLPILLLFMCTIALWKFVPRTNRTAEICLIFSCGVQFFFGIFEHANCGLRYLLPIYPFLYVFMSRLAALPSWKVHLSSAACYTAKVALILLVIWNAAESIWACPNQIAYFNTLFKNPSTKYRYIVDSNVDWGNELYALRDYMRANHITEINLQYFGNVDPHDYGIDWKQANRESKGWIAISATNLAGAYVTSDQFAEFRALKPEAVLCDGGMFVYHR